MLSNDSLLFALNSGCLNSHAYFIQLYGISTTEVSTHPRSVWRLSAFFVVMSDLVEVILVKLADEACKVAVLEVLWKNGLGEPLVLTQKLDHSDVPSVIVINPTSSTTKLSPSSPHLTTWEYVGSSSILRRRSACASSQLRRTVSNLLNTYL